VINSRIEFLKMKYECAKANNFKLLRNF